jgi:hypothetical protein
LTFDETKAGELSGVGSLKDLSISILDNSSANSNIIELKQKINSKNKTYEFFINIEVFFILLYTIPRLISLEQLELLWSDKFKYFV